MKCKNGFTLIEVTLVLAITTAMLIAFMGTISARISRERYTDSTRGFADALRKIYSEVESVQNGRTGSITTQNKYCTLAGQAAALAGDPNATPNPSSTSEAGFGYAGRSDCAIYGKLISFNEKANGLGFNVYDVIGRAVEFRGSAIGDNILSSLKSVYADILSFAPSGGSGNYSLKPAGDEYSFYPTWNAWLEKTDGSRFTGEILIVRSPVSGAVHTYWLNKGLDFQTFMSNYQNRTYNTLADIANRANTSGFAISKYLNDGTNANSNFVTADIDLCVGSGDFLIGLARKNNIRIKADGHNSSAVEIVATDSGDNKCK